VVANPVSAPAIPCRPGEDDGGGSRSLGEAFDEIFRDAIPLICRHWRFNVLHHAHYGAPALGRVADPDAIDVVAAAAYRGHDLLTWSIREFLPQGGKDVG